MILVFNSCEEKCKEITEREIILWSKNGLYVILEEFNC